MANGCCLGKVCYAQTQGAHTHLGACGGVSRTVAIVLATLAAASVVIGVFAMNPDLLAHTVGGMTPYVGKITMIAGAATLGAVALAAISVRACKPVVPKDILLTTQA